VSRCPLSLSTIDQARNGGPGGLGALDAEIYQQHIPTSLLCIDHFPMQASVAIVAIVAINAKRKGLPTPNAVEASSDPIIEEKAC